MASSSAATSFKFPRWNYDVFVSFSGEDTRKTFTSLMYQCLIDKGINTFLDNRYLEKGASISLALWKAIEESRVAIIVFSENYASSRWCLDELVKIVGCKDEYGQIVIPVFYNVDPSMVRYQTKSFAKAFDVHESRCEDDEGMWKVQKWRNALTAVANLSGYVITPESEFGTIQMIVDRIFEVCKKTYSSSLRDELVGIQSHLEKVKSLLQLEIGDVRIVGIWGMAGIGKTTLAKAIFDELSNKFDAACFLAGIKENKGIHYLQNILLSELLGQKADHVKNKEDGMNLIALKLCYKKVLIVLDDIDHRDHLDYLAGDLDWFGNGSRIIATTRDKHLLKLKTNVVYEVPTLPEHEAARLFNQYAFKEEIPDECFQKPTLEVLNHAQGLPLALKVWGSFLHKRDITEWRSALDRIKNISSSVIFETLKISYDGLEPMQKEIFLDIACFLRGRKKDEVVQILESCNFAVVELYVLIDKSLVYVSEGDTIEMHNLLQVMGKYIVMNMQKNLGKCSRLWLAEDFNEMMFRAMDTKAIEAIWFSSDSREILCFTKEAMKNMTRLRILYIRTNVNNQINDGFIEHLSNNLRWIVWDYYPWGSLPPDFEPNRLVHFELKYSSLRILWTGTKDLRYLRKLDVSHSKFLMRTPDFTGMANLEYLNLEYCTSLREVHQSLENCNKLIRLDFSGCKSLERFPCVYMGCLEFLGLQFCSSLEKIPYMHGRMKPELEIIIGHSGIKELPTNIVDKLKISYDGLEPLQKDILLEKVTNHLEKVQSLVEIEINDVRIVGIWGIGGVGKTTIARAIFDKISNKYDAACFLGDVKENKHGIHSLQNILISELLGEKDDHVKNKEDGKNLMAIKLCSKKVLIVLDDIDHRDHLDYLAGDLGWFGNGSRIIVTTRDKHLQRMNINVVYQVTTLAYHDAVQLFNQYAFKEEVPDEYFQKLTLHVVSHAKGLPLALKVWGSFFHKRDITEWRSAIEQMKYHSDSEVVDKLKISYDGLEPMVKEIFLDIACFLRGRKKDEIMQILESCNFRADNGLHILIDKSLVFISEKDTIEMHDLIQDMGKYVVNMQKDLGQDNRLWLPEDFNELMIHNMRTKAVEAIWLPYCSKLCFSNKAIKNMKKLRILYICMDQDSRIHAGSIEYLPNNLCWFVWKHYPWESLPTNFEPKMLVHLELKFSSLRQLWTGKKNFPSLRKLDLSGSESLRQTPNFTGMPNLEYLYLERCKDLQEVDDSLGNCGKLIWLDLSHCESLKIFLCVNMESLEYLNLQYCSSLKKFSEVLGRMKPELEIQMESSGIREIPSSFLGTCCMLVCPIK